MYTESEQTRKKNRFDGGLSYGTANFNNRTGRNSHVDHSRQIVRDYFLDDATGTLHQHMMLQRDCAVCGAVKHDLLFNKDGFHHVKCSACGFIFVNPSACDQYRDHFFKEVYQSWTEVLLSPEQEAIDTIKFEYGLEFIEALCPGKGKLVDIGAGSGLFLKVAREHGWEVSGVEFNDKSVENIRKLGIEVFDRPLEDEIYPAGSVDVVAIWEVLEHINDPNQFLQQIRDILAPGGLLFICVPNIHALVTRLLHEKARTFGGHTHVNFFSMQSLSALLARNGFSVLSTDTVISELGTIQNYLMYEDPYNGCAESGFDFLTPEFLYQNDLGSRILLLCRKEV